MRMTFLRWIPGLLLFTWGAGHAAYAAPPAACGTSLNAGLQILTNIPNPSNGYPDPGSNYTGGLKMAVWYPTTVAASTYQYFTTISGQVALNAPVTDCGNGTTFPLIVFSHGWSGCGLQSVFLTEQLARLGYIVAAPDHNDHGCSVDGGPTQSYQDINAQFPLQKFGDASTWVPQDGDYRHVDVSAVLDYMLNTWVGKARINPNQIAISGHSFGGYTAFAEIGGWSTGPYAWLDSRFKAGIMYSPYIQAFEAQKPTTVPVPTVPQLFMTGGTADLGIQPWVKGKTCAANSTNPCTTEPGAFEQTQFPKYYGELPGTLIQASHLAFSNEVCINAKYSTVQDCLNHVIQAQLIVNYSQDFFDYYLTGQTPKLLFTTGSGWATWWRTSGMPDGSFHTGGGGAPAEIVAIKGDNLTAGVTSLAAGSLTMPKTIAGTTATVTDTNGVSRSASLYGISPGQINLVIPDGTASGQATISVANNTTVITSGPITIRPLVPSLIGIGPQSALAAGWAQTANGFISLYNGSGSPIPLNVSQQPTYVVLWGTGFRGGSVSNARASIGPVGGSLIPSVPVPVANIAASGQYEGVDQIALGPLPASLAGRGQVSVSVTVNDQTANTVLLTLQ
jgi:uncharacterized protein (TIGR03437 family)